jgi:uncharacterized protein YndB with AHSA1/START domain
MGTADQVTVTIDAPVERVWRAMTDVPAWAQWTTSITGVERLDDGGLRPGSRTRIKQPGMPAIGWEVTSIEPGVEFTWVGRSPGVTTTGRHAVTTVDGGTQLTLTIEHGGPLAGIVRRLTRSRTMRYLQLEAVGMKACSESSAAPH